MATICGRFLQINVNFAENNHRKRYCTMYEFSLQNISDRLKTMPMAATLVSLVVGILFSDVVDVAAWVWALVALLAGGLAVAMRGVRLPFAMLAVCCFGAGLYAVSRPAVPPYDEPRRVVLRVLSESVSRERSEVASAEVLGGEGVERGVRLRIYSPKGVCFSEGDRVEATLRIRRFDRSQGDYGRLMYHRGYVGVAFLNDKNIHSFVPSEGGSLHARSVERLRGAMTSGEARAVAMAMGVGERSELTAETRTAYSRSGAAHLLAVSGLHVGILFLVVNLLVWPLALLRHGNAIGALVALAVLWVYVFVCGVSPSAVRAAVMFSVAQFCVAAVRGYKSGNVLCATAFVMLVVKPDLLFDLSFRMSMLAVAGIIFWGVPAMRAVSISSRPLRMVVDTMIIGTVAALWVAPLVSHAFGVVSILGVVLNPILALTAPVVLLATLLTLVLPLPVATLTARVAEWAAVAQNEVVARTAEWSGSAVEYVAPEWALWAIYAIYGVITLVLAGFRRRKASLFQDIS